MWSICKKEVRQFFSSLTGYIAIILFLLLNGLFLFVFPDTNLLDFGYATLDKFFELAPWILLLLIPAITMRSFPEEFRQGTYETLETSPVSRWQLITGKYFACLIVVLIAILPTLIYVYTISSLSTGGIDSGGIAGLIYWTGVFGGCFYRHRCLLRQFYSKCRSSISFQRIRLLFVVQRIQCPQQNSFFSVRRRLLY